MPLAMFVAHNIKDSQSSHVLVMSSERVLNIKFVGMCMKYRLITVVQLLSFPNRDISIDFTQSYFVLYFRKIYALIKFAFFSKICHNIKFQGRILTGA